jgi:ADP-heptose:LPS heptosyltransferase
MTNQDIKNCLEQIRSVFLMIFDLLSFIPARSRQQGSKKRVLIVKLDAIGDFILWLDAARGFRELFPKDRYEITLLGNSSWTALAAEIEYLDAVWPIERRLFFKKPLYRLRMLQKIRQTGFDVFVNPSFSREFLFGDAVARVCGAVDRIGFEGDCANIESWQKKISDHWYTKLIPSGTGQLMELLRNAYFMRAIGLSEFRADIPGLFIKKTLPDGFNLREYYVLFPGASYGAKRWPPANFAELASRIYLQTGWVGIICGGPGEESLGKELAGSTDAPLQDWVARTCLQELVGIISNARLLVANDTSAIHIAAAVSTSSVCILGGGHFGRFLPYKIEAETIRPLPVIVYHYLECFGCNWKCIHDPSLKRPAPCLTSISVNDVWEVVDKVRREKSLW